MPKFVKGQSGNPSGRPKGLPKAIKDKEGLKSFNVLIQIRDGRLKEAHYTPSGKLVPIAPSLKDVREAAKLILAYCWGQPQHAVVISGEEGGVPITIYIPDNRRDKQ